MRRKNPGVATVRRVDFGFAVLEWSKWPWIRAKSNGQSLMSRTVESMITRLHVNNLKMGLAELLTLIRV